MPRHSISFTVPNDNWLKSKVDNQEYTSKSEVVNDLIRKARQRQSEIEETQAELVKAEESGFTDFNAEEIRQNAKKRLKKH